MSPKKTTPKPEPKPKAPKPKSKPAPTAKRAPAAAKPAATRKPAPRKAKTARAKDAALRVLMVASEAHPFAKTGGLAEVLGALPAALARLGHDVTVVVPRYRGTDVTGGTRIEHAFSLAGHLYVLYGTVQIDVYSRGGSDAENLAEAKKIAEVLIPRI